MQPSRLQITAEELIRQYGEGRRDFRGEIVRDAKLSGAKLAEANLCIMDLSRSDLSRADLRLTNLARTNLSGSNLSGADLSEARLSMSSLSGANLSGANLSGANLTRAKIDKADLSRADLRGANLTKAILSESDLSWADIRGTDLTEAELGFAKLTGAQLCKAYLGGARLSGADLRKTDLSDARLRGTYLGGTNFSGANLHGADLGGAYVGGSMLIDVDLSAFCSAEIPVNHLDASVVDYRSIVKSVKARGLKSFLRRTGMPEVFVEYSIDCARSLDPGIMFSMMQSTFLSYGAPNEAFARKLYEALHRNGVTTFFFAEHAVPGEKLHRMMRKGVNEHDRVILVCSKDSLDRKGVLNEIEEILTREASDGGASYLIPIRLDGYVFNGWNPPNPDLAQAVRARVVADFEGTETDDAKFGDALQRLLGALRKK